MGGREEVHIDSRYTDLQPLGDGSYGFVVSALDTITGNKVAIKKMTNCVATIEDAKRVAREIKLLRHLDGRGSCLSLLDVMVSPPTTHSSPSFTDVYTVCNLYESDLEHIIASEQPLSEAHAQYFCYQMLRSLKYIHSASVLHRDLKPSNLLVNSNCDLAVCDFGLARGIGESGGPGGQAQHLTE